MKMLQLEGIYLYLVIKILKHYKMKLKFSFLIIFLIISQTIISQTKKTLSNLIVYQILN